jgi:hypothetical protein
MTSVSIYHRCVWEGTINCSNFRINDKTTLLSKLLSSWCKVYSLSFWFLCRYVCILCFTSGFRRLKIKNIKLCKMPCRVICIITKWMKLPHIKLIVEQQIISINYRGGFLLFMENIIIFGLICIIFCVFGINKKKHKRNLSWSLLFINFMDV